MQLKLWITCAGLVCLMAQCNKNNSGGDNNSPLFLNSVNVNGVNAGFEYDHLDTRPVITLKFSVPVDRSSVPSGISLKDVPGTAISFSAGYANGDSTLLIQPENNLESFTRYNLDLNQSLQSTGGQPLKTAVQVSLSTGIDSTDKFPRITDDSLLTLVQKQTFKYFWDFGHPVSGLARERNTSGETVTSGGSGFGIMSIVVGVHRGFISRAEGYARMQKIVGFLKNDAAKFHGAFSHWLNGTTGAVVPFSTNDNGADLVETSFLIQGLLCARQYFDAAGESSLRDDINAIWNGVEWDWFRKNNSDVLYWHWSPDFNWDKNLPVRGWNECLVTYVLAASSATHGIPKSVYDNGWAGGANFINNNNYYGYTLPLGPNYGDPLFFAHYSFQGINPTQLSDAYANYTTQNKNHSLINYNYCVSNPSGWYGYSESCWGLTASDDINGYKAHSPTNDNGVITPTAALSSMPYTPEESMRALKFFYYKLGDKLWGDYGFYDAFSLQEPWFATSTLAIDQGPIINMIENHRSGLLWDLFMSCPEIKTGMIKLGFQSPNL